MMPCSWEGNCRSGVALAMYQTSGLSTYGLTAQGREMTTPPALLIGMAHFTFTFTLCIRIMPIGESELSYWTKYGFMMSLTRNED